MIRNTYFKLKSLKRKIPFKALYTYKGTGKEEEFQKLSNKEIYFTRLTVPNDTKNLSNSFHTQTSLRDTLFSFKKALMDIYVLRGKHLFIFLFP